MWSTRSPKRRIPDAGMGVGTQDHSAGPCPQRLNPLPGARVSSAGNQGRRRELKKRAKARSTSEYNRCSPVVVREAPVCVGPLVPSHGRARTSGCRQTEIIAAAEAASNRASPQPNKGGIPQATGRRVIRDPPCSTRAHGLRRRKPRTGSDASDCSRFAWGFQRPGQPVRNHPDEPAGRGVGSSVSRISALGRESVAHRSPVPGSIEVLPMFPPGIRDSSVFPSISSFRMAGFP